ncbi:MAG: hypothetical protein JW709_09270 [Sedimentisphaerales bacterium]|nr:hypothetical protein [Sedimentisphaerales bacterium]
MVRVVRFKGEMSYSLSIVCMLFLLTAPVYGQLQAQDLLLVVNQDSPTSVYVADLYRQYYPSITDDQIVYLSGLPDAALNPANEIVSRNDFESKIAQPIRQHLLDHNSVNATKSIVTTAGLPYRISDSAYPNLVRSGGSTPYNPYDVGYVAAASVESELAVLWQVDPASPTALDTRNRLVNPYQGYRSSPIDVFDRDIIDNRQNLNWCCPLVSTGVAPTVEGQFAGYGYNNRNLSAGDIYLTCRLDGPKTQNGNDAVFAVHDMLERSRRASSTEFGINIDQAVAVIDDISGWGLDYNKIFNVNKNVAYNTYNPETPQPPDITMPSSRDDFSYAYYRMTGQWIVENEAVTATMPTANNLSVLYDQRPGYRTSQADLGPDQAAVAVVNYGCNGEEGSLSDYLLHDGPEGGALFDLAYGAVFNSIESFNAVTMFSDIATGQGKIVDFISIGGSGAIGHAFEPLSDAIVDNEFLLYNLFADHDGDGVADMTFVEAAFTALPFLSWSEVVIGDPLMRYAYCPGGLSNPDRLCGDVDFDGYVTSLDLYLASLCVGAVFGDTTYLDGADVNQDGQINSYDMWLISKNIGNCDPSAFGMPGQGDSTEVPEPASWLFIASGFIVTLYKKRRYRI